METAQRMVNDAAKDADVVLDNGRSLLYKTGELRYDIEDDELIIDNVEVPIEDRRQGISKKLLNAAIKKGYELNLPITGYVYPQDDNTDYEWLRDYYENIGFDIDGYDLATHNCYDTKEVIKSADPILYDNNGHIIPLSVRFGVDEQGNLARFSLSNNSQEIFVSNAKRAVDGIKQEKATPDSVTALRIKHSKKPIDITFQKPPDGRGERRQNRLTTSK